MSENKKKKNKSGKSKETKEPKTTRAALRSSAAPKQSPAPKKKAPKATPAAGKKSTVRRTKKTMVKPEAISLRAYYIAERRRASGEHGDEDADWVEAERQLIKESTRN